MWNLNTLQYGARRRRIPCGRTSWMAEIRRNALEIGMPCGTGDRGDDQPRIGGATSRRWAREWQNTALGESYREDDGNVLAVVMPELIGGESVRKMLTRCICAGAGYRYWAHGVGR